MSGIEGQFWTVMIVAFVFTALLTAPFWLTLILAFLAAF